MEWFEDKIKMSLGFTHATFLLQEVSTVEVFDWEWSFGGYLLEQGEQNATAV